MLKRLYLGVLLLPMFITTLFPNAELFSQAQKIYKEFICEPKVTEWKALQHNISFKKYCIYYYMNSIKHRLNSTPKETQHNERNSGMENFFEQILKDDGVFAFEDFSIYKKQTDHKSDMSSIHRQIEEEMKIIVELIIENFIHEIPCHQAIDRIYFYSLLTFIDSAYSLMFSQLKTKQSKKSSPIDLVHDVLSEIKEYSLEEGDRYKKCFRQAMADVNLMEENFRAVLEKAQKNLDLALEEANELRESLRKRRQCDPIGAYNDGPQGFILQGS